MAHFLKLSACLHLLQYLPLRHGPGITRERAISRVTFLFFARACVNSILYTSWSSYKLLLSMPRFLFTISTVFLPLDELQAEVFLKAAAETIPPPCCRPSPAARLSHQYTTAHQPTITAEMLQQQLEAPPEAAGLHPAAASPLRWATQRLCFWTARPLFSPGRMPAVPLPRNATAPLVVPRYRFSLRFGESYSDVHPQT